MAKWFGTLTQLWSNLEDKGGHVQQKLTICWCAKRHLLMLFLKVEVHLGSSAKIKRKMDPIPQKNLTFWGLFFETCFDHFLEVSFRGQI